MTEKDFPRYVFTEEGNERDVRGTYGVALVEAEEDYNAALEAGYKANIYELFEAPEPEIKVFEAPKPKVFKKEDKKDIKIDEDDGF